MMRMRTKSGILCVLACMGAALVCGALVVHQPKRARGPEASRRQAEGSKLVVTVNSQAGLTAGPTQRKAHGQKSLDRGYPVPASAPEPATKARIVQTYMKLPLSFEPNRGQAGSREIKFLARGKGYSLGLTPTGAMLALSKPPAVNEQRSSGRQSPVLSSQLGGPAANPQQTTHGIVSPLIENPKSQIQNYPVPSPQSQAPALLRMEMVGANPAARPAALEELPSKSNYFIGNDPKQWRTDVPTYAKVRYQDVYPGVDLVYYGNQGQLEYDFVVAPGADPKAIAVEIVGSGLVPAQGHTQGVPLRIDPAGDLVITTAGGDVRFHKPVVYQPALAAGKTSRPHLSERRDRVEGRFVLLAENRVGFAIGAYDPALPLVIDPVLSYSSFLGGSGSDRGFGVAVDTTGAAYVTGDTNSSNFPKLNPYNSTLSGTDAFVAKFDTTLSGASSLIYSTYLGGSGTESGKGVAVDSAGAAYVTGNTFSANFPTLNGLQTVHKGTCGSSTPFICTNEDAFLLKLAPAGNSIQYSTFMGDTGGDVGWAVAVDSAGNAYVTGHTFPSSSSGGFPITAGAFQTLPGSTSLDEAFFTKIDTTQSGASSLVYSTYLGGSLADEGHGISVDSTGAAYVAGYTTSSNFPTKNPFQAVKGFGVNFDAFVAKFDPTQAGAASLIYSTYLGGTGYDLAYAVAVDSLGAAYVTGATYSTDFPTLNAIDSTFNGPLGYYDLFVTKFSPAGDTLVYSTYLGGTADDYGQGIAVDSSGAAYVTGYTTSTDFPTVDPLYLYSSSYEDVIVAAINPAGSALVYSTYLGGASNRDYGYAIAASPSGTVYVTGSAGSIGPNIFPTTANAFQTAVGGSGDAFLVKIASASGVAATTAGITAPAITYGADGSVTVSVTSDGGTVTGDVSLSVDGGTAVTQTLSGGSAIFTVTKPLAGDHTLDASYAAQGSFDASTASGTLHVNQAPLTITADDNTKFLNAPNPSLSATYSGFVLGEGPGDLTGTLSCTTTAMTLSPVGSYPITCTGQSSPNYAITPVSGTLKILYAAMAGCSSILQPINADGSSVFKRGSTVPAKFRVCDANGNSIGTPGVVTDFVLYQTMAGLTTSVVNEPVDSTTPDLYFRWSGDQWIFNINTKGYSAGVTYFFRVSLNDGTEILFNFGLK
jgi:MBG domain (YGX type)/Beta-propeller repeat/Bacterial Ig-like domain (group 3)